MQPKQDKLLNQQNPIDRRKRFQQRGLFGPFIRRLYNIVNNSELTGVIPRPNKKGFTIVDHEKFINITLPKNYPKCTFKLFLKQLNEYHFDPKDDQSPHLSFEASHFDLDKPNKAIKTKRRLRKQIEDQRYRRQLLDVVFKGKIRDKNLMDYESQDYESLMSYSNIEQSDYPSVNPESSVARQGPFDRIQDESITELVRNLGNLEAEQQMITAEIQYLKDSTKRQRINVQEVLKSDRSTNFKFHYFQKMQHYKLRELQSLINSVNVSHTTKSPFQEYFDVYRYIHPLSRIGYGKVQRQTRECFWDCQFSQNALELEHSENKVDFDQFFKFQWKDFQILRFRNCSISNTDWIKFCNQAKKNLPNLKQIYFGQNMIQFVRKSDFEQLNNIIRIQLSGNKLNPLCENEIQDFVKRNSSIIIERD